jgi:hypothetical protein
MVTIDHFVIKVFFSVFIFLLSSSTEFFIDLVSKMEDMTPDTKGVVKSLFSGTLTNNVVSLDCNHVSRTAEEFYTVRCQECLGSNFCPFKYIFC